MSVPDPVTIAVTGGLVLSGANQVAKQAQDFLSAVTGHPGESIGTILGNIARKRASNLEETLSDAHFTLLNIGVTPQPVALKIFQPLAEAASLEEEPEFRRLWANLMANAADPRGSVIVRASFAQALRQLTSNDVRFLDSLYDFWATSETNRINLFQAGTDLGSYGVLLEIFHRATHGELTSVNELQNSRDDFEIALDTLKRTGIINSQTHVMQGSSYSDPIPIDAEMLTKERYVLTPFGSELVLACRPPVKA